MNDVLRGKTLIDFLKEHAQFERASFHMPGHKGRKFFESLGYGKEMDMLVDGDITEISGADNLFQAEGLLRNLMNRYKAMYGADEAFLLVGGSSAGIISAILSTIGDGDSLIMASNCHKSVYNGLMLAGGKCIFVNPEIEDVLGLAGGIKASDIEVALEKNPHVKAVFITSPNYYGICSDIEGISRVCHEKGVILIVDEAHGAHLSFFDKLGGEGKKAAEMQGADIVIMSSHKTMASFTQTAIALICSDRVSVESFANKLEMIESSSPSYILMASLELNADIVENHGRKLIKSWNENLEYIYGELGRINGLKLLRSELHDKSKLVISLKSLGISGYRLDKLLQEKGIFVELADSRSVMAMTGIGNNRRDYEVLIDAIKEIIAESNLPQKETMGAVYPMEPKGLYEHQIVCEIPVITEAVKWDESAGRISARAIIPYPPGISIIVPGEVVTREKVEYAWKLRCLGHSVIGMDEAGFILCSKSV